MSEIAASVSISFLPSLFLVPSLPLGTSGTGAMTESVDIAG